MISRWNTMKQREADGKSSYRGKSLAAWKAKWRARHKECLDLAASGGQEGDLQTAIDNLDQTTTDVSTATMTGVKWIGLIGGAVVLLLLLALVYVRKRSHAAKGGSSLDAALRADAAASGV